MFLKTAENRDWLSISPDNRWVLFRAGGHPGNRLFLRGLDSGGVEWPIGGRTTEGHWRADSRQIYYIAGRTMMAHEIDAGGDELRLGAPIALFPVPEPYTFGRNFFTVSPDGPRFLLRIGP